MAFQGEQFTVFRIPFNATIAFLIIYLGFLPEFGRKDYHQSIIESILKNGFGVLNYIGFPIRLKYCENCKKPVIKYNSPVNNCSCTKPKEITNKKCEHFFREIKCMKTRSKFLDNLCTIMSIATSKINGISIDESQIRKFRKLINKLPDYTIICKYNCTENPKMHVRLWNIDYDYTAVSIHCEKSLMTNKTQNSENHSDLLKKSIKESYNFNKTLLEHTIGTLKTIFGVGSVATQRLEDFSIFLYFFARRETIPLYRNLKINDIANP